MPQIVYSANFALTEFYEVRSPEVATLYTKTVHLGDAPSTSGLIAWQCYVTQRGGQVPSMRGRRRQEVLSRRLAVLMPAAGMVVLMGPWRVWLGRLPVRRLW
jgi:hypothetical protein